MKSKKFILWGAALLILVGFIVTNAICDKTGKVDPDEDNLYKQIELFSDSISYVRTDYVDKVTAKDLIYGALTGMLASLDPHSQFMDPDTYKEIKVETKGEFGGIGIEITIKDGVLTIITPLDDTPGYKAGIKPGDMIVKIEGESTKGITLLEAVKKLRGKPGTDVNITILREKENEIFDLAITRGLIKIKSIKEAKVLEDRIGYIRLSEFQENSPKDLRKALTTLKKEGIDSLILDLRNNPGGLLDVAADVADEFLEAGVLIVSTKGRIKEREMIFKARMRPTFGEGPLVIMINEGSASASEIVAGAIQDNQRGIILGTKSFGKGSVQTVIPLKDGSALRLTTAKYFTPNGHAIREEGIMPDVVVEYEEVAVESKLKEEEIFEKVEEFDLETPYDNQLNSAIDLIKGIKVYEKAG